MKSSDKLIADLTKLGEAVKYLSGETDSFPKAFNEVEIREFEDLISRVHVFNGWFTADSVKKSLAGIAEFLNEEQLIEWGNSYNIPEKENRIGIVMAGNIPMVGFHDLLSVLISGNRAIIKLSKDDDKLIPALLNLFYLLNPDNKKLVQIAIGPMKEFDAVIATGSDNTSRYFKEYFKNVPSLIRKNRTSIAVLDQGVSDQDLELLGSDVFDYYGLGCRNVSKIFIPEDFEIDRFFKAIYNNKEVINHNKYANNYDYNKAVYLMNEENLLDNGFLLLKESDDLFSPLGMLYYQRYQDLKEVEDFIESNKDKIQAVVGKGYISYGEAQKPSLTDYADGVDTMEFLCSLD